MKVTLDKFADTILELSGKVRQMALNSCTNYISANYLYILSETGLNQEGNFHSQREQRIKLNNKKTPLSLDEACVTLYNQYDNLYDINVFVYRVRKSQTVIDIQYLRKDKLEKSQQSLVKDNAPMLHAKLAQPPYLRDENLKFDVNWEHQKLKNRWKIYLMKRSHNMKILLIVFALLSFGCKSQKNDTVDKTQFMIEEILKIEDPTAAIIELDEYLNKKSNYCEKINSLSEPEKVVLFVENLEREINNGGFNQFYFNSSGNYAYETYQALTQIGAIETAKIVLKANNAWPNSHVIKDSSERQDLLLKIEPRSNTIWNECDEQFYEYKENISALLFEYVKKNKSAFD